MGGGLRTHFWDPMHKLRYSVIHSPGYILTILRHLRHPAYKSRGIIACEHPCKKKKKYFSWLFGSQHA